MSTDLRDLLARHLGTPVTGLRRLAGGASHETWACDAGDRPLVVRREVDSGLLAGDLRHEFDLLLAVHAQGLPVPEPVLCVTDEPRGFMVQARVDGVDLRKALARGIDEERRRLLGLQAVQLQAQIHETLLDGLDDRLDHNGAHDVLRHWAGVIDEAKAPADAVLSTTLSWLAAHLPAAHTSTLVHADFKANNLLLGPDDQLVVLDWELAHRGDPLEDLAWTLLWTTQSDVIGGLTCASDYVAEYERLTHRTVDPEALRFWQVLSVVKLWAMFLTGVRGASTSPTLLQLARSTPWLQHQALSLLQGAR